MTLPTSQKLLVISFDDSLKAQEFLLVAARLQKDGDLQLHDAVIVNRNADGSSRVTETTDVTPTRGALGGAVWGLLLGTLFAGPLGGLVVGAASAGGGALYAKLADTGISRRTADCGTARANRVGSARQPRVARRSATRAGSLPRSGARRDGPAAGGGGRCSGGTCGGESPAFHRRVGVDTPDWAGGRRRERLAVSAIVIAPAVPPTRTSP
jgi:hypothetical protein